MSSRKPRRRKGSENARTQNASTPKTARTTTASAPKYRQTAATATARSAATSTPAVPAATNRTQQPPVPTSSPRQPASASSLLVSPTRFVVKSQPLESSWPQGTSSFSVWLQESVAVSVAELALRRFVRSQWLFISLAWLVVLYIVCFRLPFGAAYFYDVSAFGLGALIVILSYALVHQLVPPLRYLRLGLRTSLRSVLGGLLLASSCLSVSLLFMLLFLTLITQRFVASAPGAVIAGAIGLLANCMLLGMLTIVLSTPATTQVMRVIFLVWLVLALSSYNATGILATVLFPAKLLLLPFATCYNLGTTGVLDWGGPLALLVEALFIAALVWFAERTLHFRLRRLTPLAHEG